MEFDVTVWALAVLFVSIPIGALFSAFGQSDFESYRSFTTREDLLAHLEGMQGPPALRSFWVCWILVVVLGGAYVAATALAAYWLRALGDRIVLLTSGG
ncbi:MAG: hypothetical protein ACRC1K_18360 [Planctomycetia bacterium]